MSYLFGYKFKSEKKKKTSLVEKNNIYWQSTQSNLYKNLVAEDETSFKIFPPMSKDDFDYLLDNYKKTWYQLSGSNITSSEFVSNFKIFSYGR